MNFRKAEAKRKEGEKDLPRPHSFQLKLTGVYQGLQNRRNATPSLLTFFAENCGIGKVITRHFGATCLGGTVRKNDSDKKHIEMLAKTKKTGL